MTARMSSPATLLPDTMTGVQQIFAGIHSAGVPALTLELVHLRVSQINGCSACVHAGITSATKAGETAERLHAVAAWAQSPEFDAAERSALALAEAATRLADRPGAVTDLIWDDAADHFNETQLAGLISMIAVTNFFNRVNTTIKEPAGATWS